MRDGRILKNFQNALKAEITGCEDELMLLRFYGRLCGTGALIPLENMGDPFKLQGSP